MSVNLTPDQEIRLINEFLKDYGIKAHIDREASVPIPGAFMSYALTLKAGGTIASIEGKLREIAEKLSQARLQDTPVRLRERPLSLEVPSQNPRPLRPSKESLALEPFEMLLGQRIGYGGIEEIKMDLRTVEHMLVAGTTGSGKSSLINAMLATILWNTPPKKVGIVAVDPKNDDLVPYGSMPHTVASAFRKHEVLPVIEAVFNEKERRIALSKTGDARELAHLLVIIDEWAELYEDPDFISMMASIMQTGRSLGIHVLAATQLPLASVIGSMGKAQLTYRLVGRVLSATDSNTATGVKGLNAHYLPGKGSFLLVANGGVTRFQAYFMGKMEVNAVTALKAKWAQESATALLVDRRTEQLDLWNNAVVVEP